jgi:hypothetical protein
MKSFQQFQEDIAQRRVAASQQTANRMASSQQVAQSYHAKKAEAQDREKLKQEIKKELYTEQTPTMQPNLYNQLIARRQVAQKVAHVKHVHQELGSEARAQQAAKNARMKSIMSR